MNKLFLNAVCVGLMALMFPASGVAQFQSIESKPLRVAQPDASKSEISIESRKRFLGFARNLPDESLTPEAAKANVISARNAGEISLANYSVEDAVIIIMKLVAEDADADVKSMLAEMDAKQKQKAALRSDNALIKDDRKKLAAEARTGMAASTVQASPVTQHQSSASQTSEALSQRLQARLDRRAKAMETLRKLMEAASSTESTVIGNIK